MSWNDDRIARAMRRADPATTPPDADPRPEDWARLRAFATTKQRAARRRAVPRWAWAVPAVAAASAVAVVIGMLGTAPSYAETPPALVATPMGSDADTVVRASIDALRDAAGSAAARDAQVVRWVYRDDGSADPVIVPEQQEWVWDDDGTGHLVATAGASYSVTEDGRIVAPAGDAPSEGTALAPDETGSGSDRVGYFPEAPPEGAADLRAYLEEHAHVAEDADALAWWGAISALRDEWTLSPRQQAAALLILLDAGGLDLLGEVRDRLGRRGIALSVSSVDREQFAATIVLGADSREIIAADIVYLGGNEKLDLEPGSVVQYSAWLRPGG